MPMSTLEHLEPDTGFWCIESAASPVSWAESRYGYLWKGRGHWEFASDEFSMTSSFSQGFCHYIVVFCYYIGAFGKLHPCVWGKSPFIMDHAIIKVCTCTWKYNAKGDVFDILNNFGVSSARVIVHDLLLTLKEMFHHSMIESIDSLYWYATLNLMSTRGSAQPHGTPCTYLGVIVLSGTKKMSLKKKSHLFPNTVTSRN